MARTVSENSMRVFSTLVMGCALFLGGWPQTALADPFKLNSGKIVDILSVKAVQTTKGRTLKLRYSSKTPLSDTTTLRKEADELWEHFFVNAERGGHSRAVISAVGPKKAARKGKPVDFVFVKRAGGWRTLEKGLGPTGKLTEQLIRKLYDHSKWINDHRNINAVMLYLANGWTTTYTYPRELGIEPFTLDRATFFEAYQRLKDKIASYNTSGPIELRGIHVSSSGMTAKVEFLTRRHATIRGQTVTMVGRLIDNLALRQGAVVSTQTHMVVEDIFEGVKR